MPDPFSSNPWGLNLWASEPARDVAQAPSLRDVLRPAPEIVSPPAPPPPTEARTTLPEFSYETEDWFQSLKQNWTPVAPLIKPELHVNKHMAPEVRDFVNRHVRQGGTRRERLQCFDFAAYQLHRAGFRTGGRPSTDERSFQILIEYPEDGKLVEEVQVDVTIEAVLYIKEALQNKLPVLIGMCIRRFFDENGQPARPNNVKSTPFVEPTNHYVVIVGMGSGNYGDVYFHYYDYYHDPLGEGRYCNFFLQPTMKLETPEKSMVMAEVRRTMVR